MKIDAHAHILPRRFYEAAERLPGTRVIPLGGNAKLIERGGVRLVGYNADWFPSEYSLRDMDRKGFDMRLISITPALPQFAPDQQAELAKIVNDDDPPDAPSSSRRGAWRTNVRVSKSPAVTIHVSRGWKP